MVAPLAAVFFTLLAIAAFLVLFAGARFDYATAGLVVSSGALIFSLASLFQMVRSLSRPGDSLRIRPSELAGVSLSSLREEKRRLLRAINELKFDFEMGKLSEADYTQVRETYELRAVEVMRALEGPSKLHPEVFALLEDRGLLSSADVEKESSDSIVPETPAAESDSDKDAGNDAGEAVDDGPDAPLEDGEASAGEDAAAASDDAPASTAAPVEQSVTCASCGGENDADAKFCKHCGEELPAT